MALKRTKNLVVLYDHLTPKEVDRCILVLSAEGIPYRTDMIDGLWTILVPANVYNKAACAIDSYMAEDGSINKKESSSEGAAADAETTRSYAGVFIALLLAAIHAYMFEITDPYALWRRFGADSDAILAGEIYRGVTALMLHKDAAHLAGNMAGIALFVTLVCRRMGWGAGILAVLCSGFLGNIINAIAHFGGHNAIGASTAVFGAVGILSGYRFTTEGRVKKNHLAGWPAIAAGLGLLAFLGASPYTDLGAHFFGFVAGTLIGVTYARLSPVTPSPLAQALCGIAAAAGVCLAWWAGGNIG